MLNPGPNMCIHSHACPDTQLHIHKHTYTTHRLTYKNVTFKITYPRERSIKTRINQSKTNTENIYLNDR